MIRLLVRHLAISGDLDHNQITIKKGENTMSDPLNDGDGVFYTVLMIAFVGAVLFIILFVKPACP